MANLVSLGLVQDVGEDGGEFSYVSAWWLLERKAIRLIVDDKAQLPAGTVFDAVLLKQPYEYVVPETYQGDSIRLIGFEEDLTNWVITPKS